MTRNEIWLSLGVVAVAGGILAAVGVAVLGQPNYGPDPGRMRQVYVASSMYEESANGVPPPDLAVLATFLPQPSAYLAEKDPYAKAAGPFPADGGLPKKNRQAPFRISFGYVGAYREALPSLGAGWDAILWDPSAGFLADEWIGKVTPVGDFDAAVEGPLLRMNRGGAISRIEGGSEPRALGNAELMFGLESGHSKVK